MNSPDNPISHAVLVPPAGPVSSPVPAARLKSVDVLRGFDMLWIVGGASIVLALREMSPHPVTNFIATQFTHVRWEGLRFYDVIYPLFLFLVGVSMVFSLDRARTLETRAATVKRILGRGAVLYLLGLFYHGGLTQPWPEVRLSGVLAFIAVCYTCAALITLFSACRVKTIAAIVVALLAGNWAIQTFVPFPDFRLDAPTVAGLAQQAGSASPAAVTAQVPARIAGVYEEGRSLSNHLDYRFLPGRKVNGHFESQGLLSPLGGVAICLLGVLAGWLLKTESIAPRRKVVWLLAGGAAALLLGLLWSLQFPIVKKLWTSSFCLVTSGLSALLLGLFYLVVDVRKWDAWCAPFLWIGMNSITIYMVAEIVRFERIAGRIVGGDVKAFFNQHVATGVGALVQALAGLALALLFVRFLYRRKIFLRV